MVRWSFQFVAATGLVAAAAGFTQLEQRAAAPASPASVGGAPQPIGHAQRAVVADSPGPHHLVALIDIDSATQQVTGIEVRRWQSPHRRRIPLPTGALVRDVRFTSDSKHLVLDEVHADGIRLSVIDPDTGASRRLATPPLSAARGGPCDWNDEVRHVLCRAVGSAEEPGAVQLAILDLDADQWQRVGPAGSYLLADLAPGGEFLVVQRDTPGGGSVELWTSAGKVVRVLPARGASHAVSPPHESGHARSAVTIRWDPTRTARLAWAGPRADRAAGDALYVFEPDAGDPAVLLQTPGRIERISWSGNGSLFATGTASGDNASLITWEVPGGNGTPRVIWPATTSGSD